MEIKEYLELLNMFATRRFFSPKKTDTLVKRVKPYANTWVRVRSWHQNLSMRKTHPDDEIVGFVEEFCADIPESELLLEEP